MKAISYCQGGLCSPHKSRQSSKHAYAKGESPTTSVWAASFFFWYTFLPFLFHRTFSVKICMRNDSIAYFVSFLLSQNLTGFAVSWFLDLQKQGALEGILGHLSCQTVPSPNERTVTPRRTQHNSKNWM